MGRDATPTPWTTVAAFLHENPYKPFIHEKIVSSPTTSPVTVIHPILLEGLDFFAKTHREICSRENLIPVSAEITATIQDMYRKK